MTAGIQCKCGRFLAHATARAAAHHYGAYLADVRGDCSRCGPDSQATTEGDAWWWSWDAWNWPDEEDWA
jgi:hypothetical protein